MTEGLRSAVVTVTHGRHDHLSLLHKSLSVAEGAPELMVVVAVDDDSLLPWSPDRGVAVDVVPLSSRPDGLPWADARNVGATIALTAGAEVLIFLDAGCVVDDHLVPALSDAVAREPDTLWFGSAIPLDPPPESGYDLDSVLGVGPPDDREEPGADDDPIGPEEVEATVFALSRDAWARLGGFHDGYVGPGFEVLDLVRTAQEAGMRLASLPRARVRLQHVVPEHDETRDAALELSASVYEQRWGDRPALG